MCFTVTDGREVQLTADTSLTPVALCPRLRCPTRSILYQRGLYPPESFERRNAHGVTVLVSTHPGLRDYVSAVLRQLGGA